MRKLTTGIAVLLTTPAWSQSLPDFDTMAYCKRLGDIAGGSYSLMQTCVEQERAAKSSLSTKALDAQIARYCTRLGQTAGGSYSMMSTCVEQEEAAKQKLGIK